jgi:hypothetical protein
MFFTITSVGTLLYKTHKRIKKIEKRLKRIEALLKE